MLLSDMAYTVVGNLSKTYQKHEVANLDKGSLEDLNLRCFRGVSTFPALSNLKVRISIKLRL